MPGASDEVGRRALHFREDECPFALPIRHGYLAAVLDIHHEPTVDARTSFSTPHTTAKITIFICRLQR